ncbi:Centromere protein J [Lamellibrachia satsuma]|nr:Centromere protein J [Lamellibrachia satsuma]
MLPELTDALLKLSAAPSDIPEDVMHTIDRRERKLFEQHQKVTRAMADKEQREEIDRLRQQLADLKEEMKKKEQRSFANTARLRERLETLELENQELKTEIRLLEQKRLEEWQRREVAASTATAAMTAMSKHSGKRLDSKGCQVTEQPVQVQPVQVQPVQVQPVQVQPEPMTQVHRDVTLRLSGAAPDAPEPMDDSTEATPQVMHPSHKPSKHDIATTDSGSIDQSVDMPHKVAGGPAVMTIIDTKNKTYEEVVHDDGKVERIYSNNAREILFANGTRKQISADGRSVVVWFFNGDIKQMMPDHHVVYYYADAKTTHTSYSDGLEILHFATGQTEKHYPDGTREITFPDQTIKYLFPNGTEESIFVDGTVIRIDKVGNKTMEFPNGQREVHTADFKRREYPDGTTKTVFPDGRQETLYSSGRFRVKDKEGNVIVDKRVPTLETCPG